MQCLLLVNAEILELSARRKNVVLEPLMWSGVDFTIQVASRLPTVVVSRCIKCVWRPHNGGDLGNFESTVVFACVH